MALRGLARRLRANHPTLKGYLREKREEKSFERELVEEAKAGDIAWDIGAFRGEYTRKLSQGV